MNLGKMLVTLQPTFFVAALGFLLGVPWIIQTGTCLAQEVEEPSVPLAAAQEMGDYEYMLEGRADPFTPFIAPAMTANVPDPNEIVDENLTLTGMQLFEPGQLTLVAILMTNSSKIAMVEDVTGRGYMLNEGTLIGRRGVVSQIDAQQVSITEKAKTRAGKELLSTVIMRLNKEGDE